MSSYGASDVDELPELGSKGFSVHPIKMNQQFSWE